MGYTGQPGGMLNVEGSFNYFFEKYLTAKGIPSFMSTAVVNYDWPRQPLTYPSFSVVHLGSMRGQTWQGHVVDEGFRGAEMIGLAQIDVWESYNRASGNDKYNIRIMADMASRVFATGASIPILDVHSTTASPNQISGTIIRAEQAESRGLIADPNPDITRMSLLVQYRWIARASAA